VVESCSPACQTCDKYLERFYEPKPDNENETDPDEPDEPDKPAIVKPTMWGVAQIMVETVSAEILEDILEATNEYMLETVVEDPDVAKDVWANCENKEPYCTYWAAQGECEENPTYMDLNCAPTCGTCDMFEYHRRCPVPEGTEALKEPGDLNSIFERIVTDDFWVDNHGPIEILSSPELTDGPWIITLENFLNEEECKGFIEAAAEEGYVRSKNLATEENEDGTVNSILSEGRTSSTSWCYSECVESSILKPVHERLEKLTGIRYNYSEYLQLLKYEVGEFYEEQ
jgi:prolyl 4-hydroxylase